MDGNDAKQDSRPSRYPDFVHTGPGTPAGRYLRHYWQPVMLSEKLAKGRAARVRVMCEDFVAFRGEIGVAQIIHPRCAHRGNLLATGWVEGNAIRCLYHGWKYDGTGQCIEQPAESGQSTGTIAIRSYPTREYINLIFGYFGPGEPPPFPYLSLFDGPGLIEADASFRRYNFFNQLENSVDEVHFNFTHRTSAFTDAGLNEAIPVLRAVETDYGIARHAQRGNTERVSHLLMPNTMLSMVFDHVMGWTEHLAWRVPVDDDSHTSFTVDFVHVTTDQEISAYRERKRKADAELAALPSADDMAEAVLRGDIHFSELPARPDLILIQDMVVMKTQDPALDRSNDVLGRSDRQITMLRNLWSRDIRAIESGGTPRPWLWPKELKMTLGI